MIENFIYLIDSRKTEEELFFSFKYFFFDLLKFNFLLTIQFLFNFCDVKKKLFYFSYSSENNTLFIYGTRQTNEYYYNLVENWPWILNSIKILIDESLTSIAENCSYQHSNRLFTFAFTIAKK